MKAIIYAGIGLFSAASIYGMVDYFNTKSKGTMEKMYKEEPLAVPEKTTVSLPVANEVDTKTVAADNKDAVATTVKKPLKKIKTSVREIKFSVFSRARIIPKIVIEEEIKAPPVVAKEENN